MDTSQDSLVCTRDGCEQPVEVTPDNVWTLMYPCHPGIPRVLVECWSCHATTELPPGVLADIADIIGPVLIMTNYAPPDHVAAIEQVTGRKVITVYDRLTPEDQELLDGLPDLTKVPAEKLELPSDEEDVYDDGLRRIVAA